MQADKQAIIGFGLAGNFANHLEQAGEAKDFADIVCDDVNAPKGIFPFYVPSSATLGRDCFNDRAIILPQDSAMCIQAEPEVALECEIIYEDSSAQRLVKAVVPKFFMACNDTSVRNDCHAKKLSQKKNFSLGSKGLGTKIPIDTFTESGICHRYSIASFISHKGAEFVPYGECSALHSYSYFYSKLTEWIACKFNTQKDFGVLEDLAQILAQANYPRQALISIGATRYMPRYEQYFLQAGDELGIVVFDHTRFSATQVKDLVESIAKARRDCTPQSCIDGVSALYQVVQAHNA